MHRVFEIASLFLLVAVVTLRPLVSESYDPAENSITVALRAISDPSPVRTLVFDMVILAAAACWLAARAIGPPRQCRWTGLEIGTAIIVVASVISCHSAGNKRLAIDGTIDWLCLPLLALTLAQVMRKPWHRRLLLCAVLAGACVQAVHCLEQYFVGFRETWEHYQSIKTDFWARQGVELDSSKVELFERRMLAREASGFLPHSSLTGSYLVLCGFGALGVVASVWKATSRALKRPTAGSDPTSHPDSTHHWIRFALASTGTALIFGSIATTGSRGAVVSSALALALWIGALALRNWICAHRSITLFVVWLGIAASSAGTIAYGLSTGGLPGWSLSFRWQYWTASARMFADHWLTGVGRENFGRHYLQYKGITSPEEVANPHNLFVQAACDWGFLGLLGIVAMLVGGSIVMTRNSADVSKSGEVSHPERTPSARTDGGEILFCIVGLVAVVTLVRIPLLGTADANFVYYNTVMTGIVWIIGFGCFWVATRDAIARDATGDRAISMAIGFGILAFLLHDMINFAAFVPGTATTLFALMALCTPVEKDNDASEPSRLGRFVRWAPIGGLAVGIGVVLFYGVIPVARAASWMSRAESAAMSRGVSQPLSESPVVIACEAAAKADPLDPAPDVRLAEWLLAAGSHPPFDPDAILRAREAIETAIARDPHNLGSRRLLANILRTKARHTGIEADYEAVIDAVREGLFIYPTDPKGVALLAQCQLEAGEALSARQFLEDAIESYRRALSLDAQRLPWEELHRLRPREVTTMRTNIARAERLLAEMPPKG